MDTGGGRRYETQRQHCWSKSIIKKKKKRKRKWRLSRRFPKPTNELLQRLDGPRGFAREKVKGGRVGGGVFDAREKKKNCYEFTTTDRQFHGPNARPNNKKKENTMK